MAPPAAKPVPLPRPIKFDDAMRREMRVAFAKRQQGEAKKIQRKERPN